MKNNEASKLGAGLVILKINLSCKFIALKSSYEVKEVKTNRKEMRGRIIGQGLQSQRYICIGCLCKMGKGVVVEQK